MVYLAMYVWYLILARRQVQTRPWQEHRISNTHTRLQVSCPAIRLAVLGLLPAQATCCICAQHPVQLICRCVRAGPYQVWLLAADQVW